MSDVPEEEEMVRYWYRKEKETETEAGVCTNNRDERNDELFGK